MISLESLFLFEVGIIDLIIDCSDDALIRLRCTNKTFLKHCRIAFCDKVNNFHRSINNHKHELAYYESINYDAMLATILKDCISQGWRDALQLLRIRYFPDFIVEIQFQTIPLGNGFELVFMDIGCDDYVEGYGFRDPVLIFIGKIPSDIFQYVTLLANKMTKTDTPVVALLEIKDSNFNPLKPDLYSFCDYKLLEECDIAFRFHRYFSDDMIRVAIYRLIYWDFVNEFDPDELHLQINMINVLINACTDIEFSSCERYNMIYTLGCLHFDIRLFLALPKHIILILKACRVVSKYHECILKMNLRDVKRIKLDFANAFRSFYYVRRSLDVFCKEALQILSDECLNHANWKFYDYEHLSKVLIYKLRFDENVLCEYSELTDDLLEEPSMIDIIYDANIAYNILAKSDSYKAELLYEDYQIERHLDY